VNSLLQGLLEGPAAKDRDAPLDFSDGIREGFLREAGSRAANRRPSQKDGGDQPGIQVHDFLS
jgi:hypothetical protein